MASNLYEILELDKTATIEQIKKAYKRKALQTHPDRLPPGSTPEDKKDAEERFRLVNNAYEVLTNEQKRKVYDQHGVWPPPGPEQEQDDFMQDDAMHRHFYERGPFQHHSSRHHFGRQRQPDPFFDHSTFFGFTDPFMLFDQIFRDAFPQMHRGHFQPDDPRQRRDDRRFAGNDPFFDPVIPFGPFASHFARLPPSFPMLPPSFGDPFGERFESTSSFHHAGGSSRDGGNRWVSESRVTQVINGATSSVWKRMDSDGNKHVTRTYPDGRETYHINGIEQPSTGGYLPPTQPPPPPPHKVEAPPPRPIEYSRSGQRGGPAHHPPPAANPPKFNPPPYSPPPYENHRERNHSNSRPFIPPEYERARRGSGNDGPVIPDPMDRKVDYDNSHKKSWWHRRH